MQYAFSSSLPFFSCPLMLAFYFSAYTLQILQFRGLMADHNRIEAIREVNVAEVLILSEDYVGARDKLLRAKQIFPNLEHIAPLLTVCDVLLSANTLKLPGCSITDHYWVLELTPYSTFSDVEFRYRKLVPILQAIRNKFPVAELALDLVHSAYSVLSDQEKRSEFDLARKKTREGYKAVPCQDMDGEHHVWSDQDLSNDQMGDIQEFCFCDFEQGRSAEAFEAGQVWAVHRPYGVDNSWYALILDKCGDELRVAWLKPSDERKSRLPVSCGSFHVYSDKIEDNVSPKIFSYKCSNWDSDMVGDDDGDVDVEDYKFTRYPRKGEIWAVHKNWNVDEAASDCKFDLVELVTEFSQYSGVSCVPLVRLDGFRSVFKKLKGTGSIINLHIPPQKLHIFSHNIPAQRLIGGDIEEVVSAVFELDQLALPRNVLKASKTHYPIEEKQCWSGDDLAEGQVWAVHCGENNMPQQYIIVDKVISETQASVTCLESESVLYPENIPIACGVFRLSETSVILGISQFSHLVQEYQPEHEDLCYTIHPKKEEVWAMYKNWNDKWEQSDYLAAQYCVVEILSELSDGNGIKIARLGEVEGWMTLYQSQRHDGFELVRVVPESEMLSFSHRIPAFMVPGIDNYGIPQGSWHLEPSALPQHY